jgi:hypothetical protein
LTKENIQSLAEPDILVVTSFLSCSDDDGVDLLGFTARVFDLFRAQFGNQSIEVLYSSTMATTSKQYKAIGEDLWKGRTEKIVRFELCIPSLGQLGPNSPLE